MCLCCKCQKNVLINRGIFFGIYDPLNYRMIGYKCRPMYTNFASREVQRFLISVICDGFILLSMCVFNFVNFSQNIIADFRDFVGLAMVCFQYCFFVTFEKRKVNFVLCSKVTFSIGHGNIKKLKLKNSDLKNGGEKTPKV